MAVLGASNFTYRRGDLDPVAAGLDRRARADVRLLRRRAAPGRARQPEGRASTRPRSTIRELNRSYGMMASHYGVGVLPARPRQAQGQGQGRERGPLRPDLHPRRACATRPSSRWPRPTRPSPSALDRINDHVIRRLGVTRRHLFETIERPALAPLPGDDYEFAEWRLARVGVDYHVEYEGFFYSVPHGLIRAAGRRQGDQPHDRAVPPRPAGRPASAPLRRPPPRHRPRSHAQLAPPLRGLDAGPLPALGGLGRAATPRRWSRPSWPTARIPSRASGPASASCGCSATSRPAAPKPSRPAPSQIGALTYKSIASILANRLGRRPATAEPAAVIDHANLRGPGYFH